MAMGLLTQEDPIGIAGGLNLYGYANGDPINFSDPFGLCGIAGAAASVAIGAGIALATGAAYGLATAAVDAGSGALCAGAFSKVGGLFRGFRASRLSRNAIRLGQAGEDVVSAATGLAKNTSVRLGSRIPDFVDEAAGVFHESKNVATLNFTAQLREMVDNLGEGQRLVIHVRQNTHISRSFNDLENVEIVKTLAGR